MPPTNNNQLNEYIKGRESQASLPMCIGVPTGAPYEVMVCGMAAAKVGDIASIPKAIDMGPIVAGITQCQIGGKPVGVESSIVAGVKGPANIEKVSTSPTVLVGGGVVGQIEPAKLPDELGDLCAGLEAAGGASGKKAIATLGKICGKVVDGSGVMAEGSMIGVLDEAAEMTAETAGSAGAVALVSPACLELTFAAGVAFTPLIGGAVGVVCVSVAAAGGSIVGREAYDKGKDAMNKLSNAQMESQKAMANKCVGVAIPNPMGGGGMLSGASCPWGGSFFGLW